jgi:hypothetical protein
MSGVAFVQDYVELHFDGRILRALTKPSIAGGQGQFTFPDPGSRDALCELIGRSVVNIVVREGDFIEVRFDGTASVRVPLSKDARTGPEAAHFVPGEDLPIEVW